MYSMTCVIEPKMRVKCPVLQRKKQRFQEMGVHIWGVRNAIYHRRCPNKAQGLQVEC